MVVVVFEVGDDYTGLEQRRPAVAVEAFVAQPVVERLGVSDGLCKSSAH